MRLMRLGFLGLLLGCSISFAKNITVDVFSTQKPQQSLGRVEFKDTAYGLLILPDIKGLPAGLHGFHLHQNPNCGDHGQDAGGHSDPKHTNSHLGPYGDGHLGDLPVLYAAEDGRATTPVLAPRLKLDDLAGLALMIHAGGDNYSNQPPLGGGGARIGCGVIK